ncbi:UV radiation resistance-associated gene protein-like [Diadema antillarum]|uniref:UV radiation resistance-associated gene protein-like n=1 Tax=Diadema antillarum TaxID=105358 RepID=UPI003A85047F
MAMSSAETSRRFRHIGLISQQRRLRHLWSLSARNITRDRSQWGTESLMETFFTLHVSRGSEAFYTSEKIQDSLNPTWRSFDLCRSCPDVNTSKSSFFVKVWGGQDGDNKLIIEWKVDLKGLYFVGSKIHKDGVRYQPNSIIFGMFDGFYSSADNLQESTRGKARFCRSLEVEQNLAIHTYNTYSLARLHTTQRAIRQTEVTVSKVRASIIQKLGDTSNKTNLCSQKEALELRLALLREEVEMQRKKLEKERGESQRKRQGIDEKKDETRLRWERLETNRTELEEVRRLVGEQKEAEKQIVLQYTGRKATLVNELSYIYPIVPRPNNVVVICNAHLPNAESNMPSSKDDPTVPTALGHTSHLVLMISKFLQIPLRYPINYNGSRSTIHDHITDSLADKDRDFPLYTRGKEKFHFNYAVYLLNRNIAQLRFVLGLPTTDLRATLPNLQSLLELKWGIKVNLAAAAGPGAQAEKTGSPKSRSSVGVQASIAGPYMSPNPPNYTSSPGVDAGMLGENIPNSPPPPYHISQAAQGRNVNAAAPPSRGREQETGQESPIQGRHGNSIQGNGSLRDSRVVVVESNEGPVASSVHPVANGNLVERDAGHKDAANHQRTARRNSLPNEIHVDSGEEDSSEVREVADIGISQPNYNSGDALSQDSLDLDSTHIGKGLPQNSSVTQGVQSEQSLPGRGSERGTSDTPRSEGAEPSVGVPHNQSNSNSSLQHGERSAAGRHSNRPAASARSDPAGAQVCADPLGVVDIEVPFMAVDRIFHFDDISTRAEALTNPGSFSSFKSGGNSMSVSKTRSVSKS